MFEIRKSFSMCYGHRVYSQSVDPVYAGSAECPCRRIHGHQGTVTVCMETEQLDDRGFVIDFKELSFMKKFIDGNIDHRFIISTQDPGFERLVGISAKTFTDENLQPIMLLDDSSFMGGRIFRPDERFNEDPHLDSFFVVSFNPTSENLAKWIYDGLTKLIEESNFECSVKYVDWAETPKTGAIYRQPK